MGHPKLSGEEIDRRGQTVYAERLRSLVETEENVGRLIVVDVETGDYEIANDGLTAANRLLVRRPDAPLLCLRIGYEAVYLFDTFSYLAPIPAGPFSRPAVSCYNSAWP
jgi:hypothetical protein